MACRVSVSFQISSRPVICTIMEVRWNFPRTLFKCLIEFKSRQEGLVMSSSFVDSREIASSALLEVQYNENDSVEIEVSIRIC